PSSVGPNLVRNLLARGFTGTVHQVCPRAGCLGELPSYSNLGEVPGAIDLALIAVPRASLSDVVRDCGTKGVGGLVVVAADEPDHEAAPGDSDRELGELARTFGMRPVGAGSMGGVNP